MYTKLIASYRLASIDCDKLIGSIVKCCSENSVRKKATSSDPAHESEKRIELMLQLRAVIRVIPALRAALNGARSSMLQSIGHFFSDPRPESMRQRIEATIDDEAVGGAKRGALATRIARAVR